MVEVDLPNLATTQNLNSAHTSQVLDKAETSKKNLNIKKLALNILVALGALLVCFGSAGLTIFIFTAIHMLILPAEALVVMALSLALVAASGPIGVRFAHDAIKTYCSGI